LAEDRGWWEYANEPSLFLEAGELLTNRATVCQCLEKQLANSAELGIVLYLNTYAHKRTVHEPRF
jgi:hypothetical protein